MLKITVKFGEPLRQTLGQRRITIDLPESGSATDLLSALTQQYAGFEAAFRGDDLGRAHPYIFFLNHRPVTASNYDATHLQNGDVVHLLLPVVGGEA